MSEDYFGEWVEIDADTKIPELEHHPECEKYHESVCERCAIDLVARAAKAIEDEILNKDK